MAILDDRLAKLKADIETIYYVDFEEPDEDDQAFVAEVKTLLSQRALTLDELIELKRPHDERSKTRRDAWYAKLHLQRSAGSHNKLYSVANKSDMRIKVIAMDVDTAQRFAAQAGHVRAAENATVYRFNDEYVAALMKDGSALGRAVREGVPGVVETRGKNVIVGDRVFTPLSVV